MEELKTPSIETVRLAYATCASDEIRRLLTTLYGDAVKNIGKPENVMERVKTFDDALIELPTTHPQVVAWQTTLKGFSTVGAMKLALGPAVVAFMQLSIIAAALNGGWTPDWGNEDEWKYYPWYFFYSKEEWDNMSEEDESRVVGRASHYANAYGGLVCSYANYVSASSGTGYGSRLAFKSKELAEYAGKQFIEIYADFLLG